MYFPRRELQFGKNNSERILKMQKKEKYFPKQFSFLKIELYFLQGEREVIFFYKVHFSFIRTILSFNRDQERNGKEIGTKDNWQS